jgi:hypothetical protein
MHKDRRKVKYRKRSLERRRRHRNDGGGSKGNVERK